MDWLITGGSGFLGRWVLSELRDEDVVALGRRCPAGWAQGRFVEADLEDGVRLREIIGRLKPRQVLHLAGATPPSSIERMYWANVLGTARLLEALSETRSAVRVVLVGSAAELGPVPVGRLPVDETVECRPLPGYGLSKWAAGYLGRVAKEPVVGLSARVFNPIGPGLPPSQAFGRFARLLSEPSPDPLRLVVGDLEARRDFIDVRDVARGLVRLASLGEAGGIYHLGTGQSRSVRDGLERLISLSGRRVEVETRAESRPMGPAESRADIRKIQSETGWKPEVSFEQSLADLWYEVKRGAEARQVA
ncbi:MAG TPA: NAD-dependent epimerase/dehydratase family protein [Isosphaeraceae bacterium]|nr:NAD-dependent epimerase/dehydratase family protein [Isosphaeraceae bacterium]